MEFLAAERERPAVGRSVLPILFALLGAAFAAPAAATPRLANSSGWVVRQKVNTTTWAQVSSGEELAKGDRIRTGSGASATITFDDDSRIELGPKSFFLLQEAEPTAASMQLTLGFLKAWVAKVATRRFEVRTPTAVCAVRGTEFSIDVNAHGHTDVHMFTGLMAVSDGLGNEAMVKERQNIRVTEKGLGPVSGGQTKLPTKADIRREQLKQVARREVGLEMSKEAVQAAAASEAKKAVYEQGKAIIDVNGNRVRIEEYIIRPNPNDFKLVVLNGRADRFDYFFYHGTFNTTLPDDLSVALRQLPGCIGTACQYYLTGYETGRSNTIDNMLETATGGHPIDVNHDGVAGDAVTAAYDPKTDQFTSLSLSGGGLIPYYQTLYNTNQLTFNGVMHTSWAPINLASAGDIAAGGITNTSDVVINNVTNLQTPQNSGCGAPNCSGSEPGIQHSTFYSSNAAGDVWDKFDNYIISDTGKVATTGDFSGVTSGSTFKSTLLSWNFETIVTASEFGGRKIDLAVEPKIFIQSGLIP
jgi:hypothetical protein